MTTVLVDARVIRVNPNGVGRYARALVPRLIELRPDWDWVVLRHSSNRRPLFEAREVFVDQSHDGVANFLRGMSAYRYALGRREADVIHSLFHIIPRGLRSRRTVVTLHDLIWIDHPDLSQPTRLGAFMQSRFASVAIGNSLRAADTVIAVSEATADAATRFVDRDKMTVVPHGVEPRYFEPAPPPGPEVRQLQRDGSRYVVAVGNDKQYKNLQTLIRAVAQLPSDLEVRLAIVGSAGELRPLARELDVDRRISWLEFLEDDKLRSVLGHASVFVFPSLVEGFGLPPLEAMAMGVPTIVSDLEPMRGVVGDAALRFEPTDAAALAMTLERVLRDEALAAQLSEDGRRRARTFDWDETARATIAVYEG
jgi:glycosyltransferase involved in cell wall biosynthesis